MLIKYLLYTIFLNIVSSTALNNAQSNYNNKVLFCNEILQNHQNFKNFNTSLCTHMIFNSIDIDFQAVLMNISVITSNILSELKKLKKDNPDLKILVNLGDHTKYKSYVDMMADQDKIRLLAERINHFLLHYHLDGINIDFYLFSQSNNVEILLSNFQTTFNKTVLLTTTIKYCNSVKDTKYSILQNNFDYIHVLCVDFYTKPRLNDINKPLTTERMIDLLIKTNISKSILVLGITFDVYQFTKNQSRDQFITILPYGLICQVWETIISEWSTPTPNILYHLTERTNNQTIMYYNSPEMIIAKIRMIVIKENLAGIAIDGILKDDTSGKCTYNIEENDVEQFSLTHTIRNELQKATEKHAIDHIRNIYDGALLGSAGEIKIFSNKTNKSSNSGSGIVNCEIFPYLTVIVFTVIKLIPIY